MMKYFYWIVGILLVLLIGLFGLQILASGRHRLMQQKYTWGDTLIGILVGSREDSIPVELHPLEP